jgi:hypothetical protein
MILCKAGALRWLTARLAAIGQMALSNYILSTHDRQDIINVNSVEAPGPLGAGRFTNR